MQFIVIILASIAAQKFKVKSVVLVALTLPVIAGLAMLYTIEHTDANEGALLAGYYLLAFLFGGNPIIVAWIVGNTAGKLLNLCIPLSPCTDDVFRYDQKVGDNVGLQRSE